MPQLAYPPTPKTEDRTVLAGVSFPDPYRWLEQDSAATISWTSAQDDLTSAYFQDLEHFGAVRDAVAKLLIPPPLVPREAAGLWFRIDRTGSGTVSVIVSDAPMGTGRTICGTIVAGSNPDAVVSWISPSPDGRILALGVCADGSENNLIHLIDVDSGELLESPHQTLMDAWTGGAHWLADSSGFFFSALEGEADKFKQAIFFHGIGKTPPSTAEAIPYPDDTRDYRVVTVSACGRWAVAAYRMIQTIPIAICDLSSSKGEWHPFVTVPDVPVYGHVAGDRYVAITFVNAPRGRIVAIPLDAADANDTECWHELVPESDAVLRSLTPVEDCIYVTEIVDTYSRIRIFGVDGFCRGELPLPSKGGLDEMHFPLMELVRSTPRSEFLFPFSSPAQSWSLLRHNRSAARVETISPPALDLNSLNIEDRSARASDGTLLPYQLIRSPGADATGPQPTVVYAYASASRCSLNSLDRWERWSSWGQM